MAINNDHYLEKMLHAQALLQTITMLEFEQQPRCLIFGNQHIQLYHYQSDRINKKKPLLIIFSTINQPDILDLHPNYSLVKSLLDDGQDVYLVVWVEPACSEKHISLDAYIGHDIDAAVNMIISQHQIDKLNMLGVCQGGLFSLCYAALYDKVDKLILLTTPVDFHAGNHPIAKIAKHIDLDLIEENIPGDWLSNFFISLRPFELVGKKYLNLLDQLDNKAYTDQFLLVEKWLKNTPNQSMLAFKQLIKNLYQDNKLIKNELYLDSRLVELRHIKSDILNIIADDDDIVPKSSSLALKQHISPQQYTEQCLASGHIGIYLNKIVSKELALVITKWLSGKY